MKEEVQTVVVTGAGSGIGLELTRLYLKQGFRVAALDIKTSVLDQIALEKTQGRLRIYQVDVSDEDGMTAVAERIVIELGIPNIWINNAGIVDLEKFEKVTPERFRRVMDVNFYGAVIGTRLALNIMRKPERGTIANVSSLNGVVPAPFMTSYVSAKHALVGFTRALQEEKRQSRSPVQICLVLPGFVQTSIMESKNGFEFPKYLKWLIANPVDASLDIIKGIEAGKSEIIPTLRGRVLGEIGQIFPKVLQKSSRMLVAKNWKQVLGLEPIKR